MKVLCNNRPTVVNLTIGYETVMSVKRVQTALLFFVCLFVFFIAFLHFPSTIRQLPCIIDIGAHKPRLLVPFAMCNCNEFLCQMITARMNSCVYDLLYLSYMYYMAIKTYSLSLSQIISMFIWKISAMSWLLKLRFLVRSTMNYMAAMFFNWLSCISLLAELFTLV